MPPGAKPSALAAQAPLISPIASDITLRWNHGGRKLCSATIQRGGKITKSALARPGTVLGEVRTVKIDGSGRSEEHTSELQSLMRISYAVFCLKKKNNNTIALHTNITSERIPHTTTP